MWHRGEAPHRAQRSEPCGSCDSSAASATRWSSACAEAPTVPTLHRLTGPRASVPSLPAAAMRLPAVEQQGWLSVFGSWTAGTPQWPAAHTRRLFHLSSVEKAHQRPRPVWSGGLLGVTVQRGVISAAQQEYATRSMPPRAPPPPPPAGAPCGPGTPADPRHRCCHHPRPSSASCWPRTGWVRAGARPALGQNCIIRLRHLLQVQASDVRPLQ